MKLVWFATGKDDFMLETSQATVAMLRKHGFDVVYKESAVTLTRFNWREYLDEFASLLWQVFNLGGHDAVGHMVRTGDVYVRIDIDHCLHDDRRHFTLTGPVLQRDHDRQREPGRS